MKLEKNIGGKKDKFNCGHRFMLNIYMLLIIEILTEQ